MAPLQVNNKDIGMLGIRSIDINRRGQVTGVYGVVYNKVYNWAILGLDYCGG